METFREYLRQEFNRRTAVNSRYSLRSFARQIGVNHATLSGILSGKRPLTAKALRKLSQPLSLSPKDLERFMEPRAVLKAQPDPNYLRLEEESFIALSEWYFDAILELSQIKGAKLTPKGIANRLGISQFRAKAAVEILLRLGLLIKKGRHFELTKRNTTNVLDKDATSAALRKYQKQILEKSMEALERVDRRKRDHTSTTIAVQASDVPRVKEMIEKFSFELSAYLQRKTAEPDSVYQLQVSFFPLTGEGE